MRTVLGGAAGEAMEEDLSVASFAVTPSPITVHQVTLSSNQVTHPQILNFKITQPPALTNRVTQPQTLDLKPQTPYPMPSNPHAKFQTQNSNPRTRNPKPYNLTRETMMQSGGDGDMGLDITLPSGLGLRAGHTEVHFSPVGPPYTVFSCTS